MKAFVLTALTVFAMAGCTSAPEREAVTAPLPTSDEPPAKWQGRASALERKPSAPFPALLRVRIRYPLTSHCRTSP